MIKIVTKLVLLFFYPGIAISGNYTIANAKPGHYVQAQQQSIQLYDQGLQATIATFMLPPGWRVN